MSLHLSATLIRYNRHERMATQVEILCVLQGVLQCVLQGVLQCVLLGVLQCELQCVLQSDMWCLNMYLPPSFATIATNA